MTLGEKIAAKALSYKGESGNFVWDYWSGLPRGSSWCVGFVLYVLYQLGLKSEIYNPSKVSSPFWLPTIEEWLHEHATHVKMAEAKPGDIVIFTWTGGGNNSRKKGKCSRDHIGFIRQRGNSNTCYTIEGNTSGGKVDEKTRKLTNIFAIYRLDCCKAGNTVKENEKIEKKVEKSGARRAVDISAWQGKLSVQNFKDIIAAGYDTVIIRSSYTTQKSFALYTDKVFEHNIQNAYKAGAKIGVYHYSQAISRAESKKESEYTVKVIDKFKKYITEPVVDDFEFGGRLNSAKAKKLGKAECTAIVKTFYDTVKAAGFEGMTYANYSTLTGYLNDLRPVMKVWLAHYAKSTPYTGYYLWQYSSTAKVPGITGNVDVNVFGSSSPSPSPSPSGKTAYSGAFPTSEVSTSHYTYKNALRWQKFLNWAFDRKVVTEDGIFGPKTKAWTKEFQKLVFESKREWDGIAGSKTLKKAKAYKR